MEKDIKKEGLKKIVDERKTKITPSVNTRPGVANPKAFGDVDWQRGISDTSKIVKK